MLTVAVCQFAPGTSRDANLREIETLVEEAVSRGARLVVFPEYSSYFTAPFDASFAEHAEALDGPFVGSLQTLATTHDVTIVAGLLERAAGSRVRNTVVAVDASGIRATYRKQHLYDAFGQTESDWVEPGALTAPETFVLGGLRIGLMTCYDLRFPEVARTLADAGVEVMVVPAEWVRGPLKEHHWQTLLAARAIENTVYVVAADHPTPIGIGHSAVIDPSGVTIAAVGTRRGIAAAALDPAEVVRTREVNPALALRRYRVTPR